MLHWQAKRRARAVCFKTSTTRSPFDGSIQTWAIFVLCWQESIECSSSARVCEISSLRCLELSASRVQLDNFLVFEFRSLRDGPLLLLMCCFKTVRLAMYWSYLKCWNRLNASNRARSHYSMVKRNKMSHHSITAICQTACDCLDKRHKSKTAVFWIADQQSLGGPGRAESSRGWRWQSSCDGRREV
jgi:hypothetical protein